MSAEPKWAEVSAPETSVELDVADFCTRYADSAQSPVDGVYRYIQSLVVLGTQSTLDSHPEMGRLLLLGFVSSLDDYFRRVLAGLVTVCPLTRERVSDKQISFGALDYYDSRQSGLSLFENTSFASLKELQKQTEAVIGTRISSASVIAAIEKYEKLCHMRHAATHAGGALSSRNARELGITSGGVVHHVVIDEARLQSAAGVCYSAARAYNRWLYRTVLEQWFGRGVLNADWNHDAALMSPLYNLFRSAEDGVGPKNAYQVFRSARAAILAASAT